jgi:hypothetical protein
MSECNGNFPETFIPNRPATVEMMFDRFTTGTTRDGDPKVIAVGEIDGCSRSLWLLGTALKSQFRKVDPKPGERLEVELAGERTQPANGREYWNDAVVAPDRPVETISVDHPLFREEAVNDDAALGY